MARNRRENMERTKKGKVKKQKNTGLDNLKGEKRKRKISTN